MKRIIKNARIHALLLAIFATVSACPLTFSATILFDEGRAPRVGNADWTIEGCYSEMAETFRKLGHKVHATAEKLDEKMLEGIDILIMPEPNLDYSAQEKELIIRWTRMGGGLFCIADHTGSDRNFSGKDSVDIINEFLPSLGMEIEKTWYSQAPIFPEKGSFIGKGVDMGTGAWAASSIKLSGSSSKAHFITEKNGIFIASSQPFFGRVVVIGDSAPFSDGTGTMDRNYHDSYHSFMFNHPQLAANIIWWLAKEEIFWQKVPSEYENWIVKAKTNKDRLINEPFAKKMAWIDCIHRAPDGDKLYSFATMLNKNSIKPEFLLDQMPENLGNLGFFISTAPTFPWLEKEKKAIKEWLYNGGTLILAGQADFSDVGTGILHNELLEYLGSNLRLADDQVLDRKYNTGRPWGPIIQNAKIPWSLKGRPIIAWGTCSLLDKNGNRPKTNLENGLMILAQGGENTITSDGNKNGLMGAKGGFSVIVAMEKIGRGTLLLSGVPFFSDFNMPDSHIYPNDYLKFNHDTQGYTQELLKWLILNGNN